jgi:hypothetical protein
VTTRLRRETAASPTTFRLAKETPVKSRSWNAFPDCAQAQRTLER